VHAARPVPLPNALTIEELAHLYRRSPLPLAIGIAVVADAGSRAAPGTGNDQNTRVIGKEIPQLKAEAFRLSDGQVVQRNLSTARMAARAIHGI
jgi:hypothetical protein